MFLRTNLREHGLADAGHRLQGAYVAARRDGVIVGVAAHYHHGMLMLQAPPDLVAELARAAVARSARDVLGLFGPRAQVVAARAALGLDARPTRLDSDEALMSLALADLRVPPPLADGRWSCRNPVAEDGPTLARWGHDYGVEALGATPSPEPPPPPPFEPCPWHWLLVADGALAASSLFTARLPDAVQIGGVYTPPPLRNRGYARAVVAGSLVDARARGVARAVLFTESPSARRAYLALGFQVVGDYGLVLFA